MASAGLGEPIIDLPHTGRGMQDHPAVGLTFDVDAPLTADMDSVYRYFQNWTQGAALEHYPESFGYPGFSTGAFLRSGVDIREHLHSAGNLTNAGVDLGLLQAMPDLQLTVFPLVIEPHISQRSMEITYNRVLVTVAVVTPLTEYTLKFGQSKPQSGGGIRSQPPPPPSSSAPAGDGGDTHPYPEVFHDHLDGADVERLVRGVKIVREIFSADPLKTFVSAEHTPGSLVSSDPELREWIVETHTSNSHWCCSARMGNEPEVSVVDGDFKVHGTSNLYVADASVLPGIPNGNVHSTVVATASLFARRLIGEL